jgi:hypothetical protein
LSPNVQRDALQLFAPSSRDPHLPSDLRNIFSRRFRRYLAFQPDRKIALNPGSDRVGLMLSAMDGPPGGREPILSFESAGVSLLPDNRLFGVAEVSLLAEKKVVDLLPVKFRELYPNREGSNGPAAPMARGSVLGSSSNLLPEPAATVASF